jgi:O-antigen/teichoic acid export membrane protein
VFKRLGALNLGSHSFFRNSAIVASGQAIGYGVALATSPIISRLYGPSDFGLLAIFVTLTSVVAVVSTLRFDNAIPLPKDSRTADMLAVIAVRCVICTAVLLLAAAACFGDALNRALFRSGAAPFTWLLAASMAGLAICEIHNTRLVRDCRFAELSRMRIVFSLTCLVTQLTVPVIWKTGPIGLLLGPIFGYAAEMLVVAIADARSKHARRRPESGELRNIAMAYRKYPMFDVGSSLLRVLAANGQALMIAWFYGPAAAGYLLLAQRVIDTPFSMLSYSISRVYYSEAAPLARESPDRLRGLYVNTLRRLFVLMAIPLGIACIIAPWSFATVFGAQWGTAGIYGSLICPLILLRVLAFILGPTLDVVHRQGLRLVRELTCVVLITAGIGLARWLHWSELTAVAVTSALGCIGYAISIALTWKALEAHEFEISEVVEVPVCAQAA